MHPLVQNCYPIDYYPTANYKFYNAPHPPKQNEDKVIAAVAIKSVIIGHPISQKDIPKFELVIILSIL